MKVIVMGFGRIGSQVSKLLADQHHDVTIIDHESIGGMRIAPDVGDLVTLRSTSVEGELS